MNRALIVSTIARPFIMWFPPEGAEARLRAAVARVIQRGARGVVLVELLSETAVYQQNAQIYPHIYPLWGIAFACVIDYTDSLEVLLISAPQTSAATGCGYV
jgi:hypothetical protein